MRQTKIFQTENHAYSVSQLPADRDGRAALLRAQKLAGKIAVSNGNMMMLATVLDEEDLEFFIELFSKYTRVIVAPDKKPQLDKIFSEHFSGPAGYQEMLQWLAFCLGFNFGPFFAWLLEHGTAIQDAALSGKTLAEGPKPEAPADEKPAE